MLHPVGGLSSLGNCEQWKQESSSSTLDWLHCVQRINWTRQDNPRYPQRRKALEIGSSTLIKLLILVWVKYILNVTETQENVTAAPGTATPCSLLQSPVTVNIYTMPLFTKEQQAGSDMNEERLRNIICGFCKQRRCVLNWATNCAVRDGWGADRFH